jgi:hypothetical protein
MTTLFYLLIFISLVLFGLAIYYYVKKNYTTSIYLSVGGIVCSVVSMLIPVPKTEADYRLSRTLSPNDMGVLNQFNSGLTVRTPPGGRRRRRK